VSATRGSRGAPRLISVIVPVLNGGENLRHQLVSLATQDYEGSWEVVVADNGSTDGTRAIVQRALAEVPAARVVDASARRGPSHARNAGAKAARGDFLSFCDADDVASPGWLSAMANAAREADVVTGPLEVERLNPPSTFVWNGPPPSTRLMRPHRFLDFASGSNCGVWAEAFHELGGFDEAKLVGEDIDFSWRAQLASRGIHFAPELVMHKRFRTRLPALARQQYGYGRANPALFRQFREAGMPRARIRAALKAWCWIAYAAPVAPWSARRRMQWVQEASLRTGQLVGSLENRVIFV
jgi:glycosyltransferase involved in cell wall biosynthesis